MIITLIKYIKSFVSITPRGMASKCSPMERYVNNAAMNPEPHSSAMNSNKTTNPISIANVIKKATMVFGVSEHSDTDVTSTD